MANDQGSTDERYHDIHNRDRQEQSYLKAKEKELLLFLFKNYKREFTPIEVSRDIGVTNKMVINRLSVLAKQGFIVPNVGNQRIRSYELSEFTRNHEQEIKRAIT